VTEATPYVCPCGAPAPDDLPGPGRAPVRCSACATPLVAPGPVPAPLFERGLGAALIVAVLGAAGWATLCHFLGTGAPWTLAVAGLVVGVAARSAARSRGGRVQLAAGLALFVFFALGEFLIYRHALLPRLEAMHAAEGAADSQMRAEEELERIREDPERYASIEATRDLFLAIAAGVAAALWVTRARPAVAAFRAPAPRPAPLPPEAPVTSASSEPSSSPPEPPPCGPASPGSESPSSAPPDAT
jgi:hypothetical protein